MLATQSLWHHLQALKRPLTTFLVDRGGALALATLALYLWVAPHHIMNGDNADFAATAAVGGAAHPSGYPLYSLWLRAWSWLPTSPAHASAIATALLAPLLVLALHAACRAWGARPLTATISVALFVTSPIALRIHSEAEVFALNCLICACVVWLSATAAPVRGTRRVVALGLVAGLGLAHNLTCVLVAPIGILGIVRGFSETQRPGRTIVAGIVALAVGLLPYLYLFATPETLVSWGEVSSGSDLVRHVLRLDYGSWKLSARGDELYPAANLASLGLTLVRAYVVVPCVLGVVAIVAALAGRARRESRAAWIALVASFVLAGPLLVGRFNVEPVSLGAYLTERFHLQSAAILAVFVAVGMDLVAAWTTERWPAITERVTARASGVFAVAAFVGSAGVSLPEVARHHSPAVEQGLRNILATVPPAAIVIGAPDELHFGMGYLQFAVGIRPDVAIITTSQLGLPYYRARVATRTGIVLAKPAGDDAKLSVVVAERALATGRPVFIDAFQANIAAAFPVYPFGVLYRVLPRGTALPSLDTLFETNKAVFASYRFGYPMPGPDDCHATNLHILYARVWDGLAAELGRAGRREDAALAHGIAVELAPR